jgi:hypothetical protein
MTQEHRDPQRRGPVEEVTPETFDRLDALSRPLAERVIRRAIELHHDEVHGPDRITRDQLDQIATELGIEPQFVQMAIIDELEAHRDNPSRSMRERLLAPDRISAGRIMNSDRAETEKSIIQWLRGAEGFRPRARTGSGYVWERDDHWSTKLRMGIQAQPGSLRGLKTVTHRHTDLGDGRQLVELDADARVVSRTGAGLMAGFGAASVLGGVAAAAGVPGGNDVAQFLSAMVPTAAVGVAAGLITAKVWAANIRQGIIRALDGISSPDLYRKRDKIGRRKTGIAKILDDIGDAIEDIFD